MAMKTTKGMRIDRTWKLCLEMWDWIVEQIKAERRKSVETLKTEWCKTNGYKLNHRCFFCDVDERKGPSCTNCPARAIDKNFHCSCEGWHFGREPLKFHAKLHRMNKKRQAMKG